MQKSKAQTTTYNLENINEYLKTIGVKLPQRREVMRRVQEAINLAVPANEYPVQPPVDNDHVAEGCQRFGLNLDAQRKPILEVME